MVAEASGCCASEVSAVATARPSPSAGPIHPTLIVMPAVTMEATAMTGHAVHRLSFGCLHSWFRSWAPVQASPGLARADGGRDVDRGQDAEDVGLHHAGEQAEHRHDDRKKEGRDGQQNTDDHRPAHHVAEQADGQGQRARKFTDDVERQHDDRRLHVGLKVTAHALLLDAENRHGHKYAQRERRGGRERTRRRLVAGKDGAEAGGGDEQKERAQKAEILLRMAEADLFDLFLDPGDDDFQKVLPAGTLLVRGKFARDEFGADGQHEHQSPCEHDGAVEFEKPCCQKII